MKLALQAQVHYPLWLNILFVPLEFFRVLAWTINSYILLRRNLFQNFVCMHMPQTLNDRSAGVYSTCSAVFENQQTHGWRKLSCMVLLYPKFAYHRQVYSATDSLDVMQVQAKLWATMMCCQFCHNSRRVSLSIYMQHSDPYSHEGWNSTGKFSSVTFFKLWVLIEKVCTYSTALLIQYTYTL